MTVLDAQNLLYEWFATSDSFEINRDMRKVVPIMENEEETGAAFRLALQELTANSLISPQDYGDKKYYVLIKSYESYVQTIELSVFTTKWLAGEINEFCAMIEDNTDLCTTSSINDKDIRNLVHIIQFYKQKTTEKEDIISGMNVMSDFASSDDKGDDGDDDGGDDEGEEENKRNKKKK
jgi:hypothetical protein